MRILVVEDHAETRKLVARALRDDGYTVEVAQNLAEARDRVRSAAFRAIVLDWMLPDGSGLSLCRDLRDAQNPTPVLMLTARGDVRDRVEGLDAGADDYLRKPFAVAELLARIRALDRRGPRLEDRVIRIGDLEVRLAERRVLSGNRDLLLTAREFDVLEILLRRRNRIVTRSDILQAAWGEETASAEASLEVIVARLRRKLASCGDKDRVRTHRGLGYSIGVEE